jgi:glycosyl transferase family 87
MAYAGAASMAAMMADVPPLFQSRRIRWVLVAASVLGLIIGIDTLILHVRLDPLADVRAYYDAGARLNAGLPLYIQSASTDDPGFYRYPPLLAIAFRPLALLPYETAALIWEAILIVLFVGTLVRLGLRNPWTWIVSGWLAAPIAWSLAIGQAQVAVTFLVALGFPWAIALAGNLKILPIVVAVYWIGRRDWRAIRHLAVWLVGLVAVQFVLEPAGTIAFISFSDLGQVGNVQNRSLYGFSPLLWGAFVVVFLAVALRYAPTKAGWALAVSASVLVSPRLLMYQLSTLQAAVRSPDDDPVSGERLAEDGPALTGEHDPDDDGDPEPEADVAEGRGEHRAEQREFSSDA